MSAHITITLIEHETQDKSCKVTNPSINDVEKNPPFVAISVCRVFKASGKRVLLDMNRPVVNMVQTRN